MRIGELASRSGITTRALRFYEAEGLLPARRSANGYRDYSEADVQLVTEIRRLQEIGLSLDETRPFVACLRSGHATGYECADSVEVMQRKLAEIDDCMRQLRKARVQLVGQIADAFARQPCGSCERTP